MDPMRAARLATATAQKLPRDCASRSRGRLPAMGGVIIGHEMGRALGVEAMFVERPTGTFELRRGFTLIRATRC
jgi:orotate phosphoribosyltransferase